MIVNKLEFLLMNNPIRAHIQDRIEAKEFGRLSSLPPDKVVLEIGCGNGTGTKLIKKYFSPKEIYAVDLLYLTSFFALNYFGFSHNKSVEF